MTSTSTTNTDCTYIVSGYMRSGTSMMMNALTEGGLTSVFKTSRNKMNDVYGDTYYKPNPNGFYELEKEDYLSKKFIENYRGKLIKLLWAGLVELSVGNYKIVFMKRHPEEIRQSFEAFFSDKAPRVLERYSEVMEKCIEQVQNRKDMDITVLNYRDVINNSKHEFQKLINKNWPINIDKAVSVINPNLYRFRLEKLIVGI